MYKFHMLNYSKLYTNVGALVVVLALEEEVGVSKGEQEVLGRGGVGVTNRKTVMSNQT